MSRAAVSLTTGLEALLTCPICFSSRNLDGATLVSNARLGGSVQLWEWIDDGAITFSY